MPNQRSSLYNLSANQWSKTLVLRRSPERTWRSLMKTPISMWRLKSPTEIPDKPSWPHARTQSPRKKPAVVRSLVTALGAQTLQGGKLSWTSHFTRLEFWQWPKWDDFQLADSQSNERGRRSWQGKSLSTQDLSTKRHTHKRSFKRKYKALH